MGEDDAEAYKRQMLELRKKQLAELQKKQFLKQILDDKAYERVMNIRMADGDFYEQLVSLLAYLQQQGQVKGKITEERLLSLLNRLKAGQREPTITLKRK